MEASVDRRRVRRGTGRSKVSAYSGSRYHCRGDKKRDGCGRAFIHPGECPYCRSRLS